VRISLGFFCPLNEAVLYVSLERWPFRNPRPALLGDLAYEMMKARFLDY
jgi:hypothetical protein